MIALYLSMIDGEDNKRRFERLYYKYKGLMYYTSNQILHNPMLAEESVQEAFFRIAQNFDKITEVDCPQTQAFVVIITRNISLDLVRKERKCDEVPIDEAENYSSNIDDTFDNFAIKELKSAIRSLNEDYRTILFLYGIYGYNTREVANLLDISNELAKKRLQRARKALAQVLMKGEMFQ